VKTSNGGAFNPAEFDGTNWRFSLEFDPPPDGVTYPVTARVTDGLKRTITDVKNVSVDVVPPTTVSITLSYRENANVHPLAVGQTIHEFAPTLIVDWTASSDGSGLANYLVGWDYDATPNDANLTSQSARHFEFAASEAQTYYAHVISQDTRGNRTLQTVGPIYVDAPTTPDLIGDLTYHGWMESCKSCGPLAPQGGASLISADQEISQTVTGKVAQKFYTSWNNNALRMAWTGADWNTDGDLFIYLDTQGGGATSAFNPYGGNGTIQLPSSFGADYLVWIQDDSTASLRHWNGSAWVLVQNLGSANFALDTTASPNTTDVYLPFNLLGVNSSSSLKMLALASEDNALQFWASAPDKNPLNSAQVISKLAKNRDLSTFQLTQSQVQLLVSVNRCCFLRRTARVSPIVKSRLIGLMLYARRGIRLSFDKIRRMALLRTGRIISPRRNIRRKRSSANRRTSGARARATIQVVVTGHRGGVSA
jgi:hypothetical protein